PMSRALTVTAPAGMATWYWPCALVRAVRAVPTITTLTLASGAPSFAASTVPLTVPVCWAASAVGEAANKTATQAREMRREVIGRFPVRLCKRRDTRRLGGAPPEPCGPDARAPR